MPLISFRKSALALLVAASFPAFAADYYVVSPVPGKTISKDSISVVLNPVVAPEGVVGQPYPGVDLRQALSVSGDPDYTGYGVKWLLLSGKLPTGLVLNSNGTITGTPASAETSNVTIRASYKTINGDQTYKLVTLNISVGLSSATLPAGVTGATYSSFDFKPLLSVTGDPAYTAGSAALSLVSGSLPAGLTLGSAGVLSGTPTAAGTSNFTLRAAYKNKSAEQSYSVQVAAANVSGSVTADTSSNFGTVPVGSSATRTFTFVNNGNTSATGVYATKSGTGLAISTPNTCGTVAAPITLAKGASCSFAVSYAPTAGGLMSGAVAVNWAGPNSGSASLPVSGSASVDYSSLMAGYTRDAVPITGHTAWVAGQQWYWSSANAQVSAPAATVEFRRPITVSGSAPVTVYLYGSVDNTLTNVAVNGSTIATNVAWGYNAFGKTVSFTLQPGVNVIAVQVNNAGTTDNPAGMTIQVRNADGSVLANEAGWKF